jgi:hypothetical protein
LTVTVRVVLGRLVFVSLSKTVTVTGPAGAAEGSTRWMRMMLTGSLLATISRALLLEIAS